MFGIQTHMHAMHCNYFTITLVAYHRIHEHMRKDYHASNIVAIQPWHGCAIYKHAGNYIASGASDGGVAMYAWLVKLNDSCVNCPPSAGIFKLDVFTQDVHRGWVTL